MGWVCARLVFVLAGRVLFSIDSQRPGWSLKMPTAMNLSGFNRAFLNNDAASAFTKWQPTVTQPTGSGVFEVPDSLGREWIKVVAFGTGTVGQTFNFRRIDYDSIGGLFVPTRAIEVACTLADPAASPAPEGVAGEAITDADTLCDEMTVTNAGVNDFVVVSPADDTAAWIMIPLLGASIIRWEMDMTGAASGNLLFSLAR